MRKSHSCLVAFLLPPVLALLAAVPGVATTFVMMSDEALAGQAELIARVRILEATDALSEGLPWTDYRVEVERVFQGSPPGSTLVVRVPGGERGDGTAMEIFGAPRFSPQEEAVLFLASRDDGTYGILQLMLGAFHEVARGGRRLLLRDLSGAREIVPPGRHPEGREPGEDRVRDASAFESWLADRAAGLEHRTDYFVDLPAPSIESISDRFSLFDDGGQCGGGRLNLRWFRFDQGQAAIWKANQSGQSGMAGGGFTELGNAMAAWNQDPGSTILYSFGGTTSSMNVPAGAQGIVVFDDPGNEIQGTFSCTQGGTLAIGGPSFTCTSQTFQGTQYREIGKGRIVTQDGAGCFFGGHGGKDGEETFAHELGHTLGLGHSSISSALMFATAHGDGRGASLSSDDRQAVAQLYGSGGGVSPVPPAAPSDLTATALSSTTIRLSWRDNASNEDEVRVEMRTTGSFRDLGSVPAGTTAVSVQSLTPETTYTFRVRACNTAGCSTYSNEAGATTAPIPSLPPPPGTPAAPSGLVATALSPTEVRLTWQDRSSDEQEFLLEQSGLTGFSPVGMVPANTTVATVTDLEPETSYSFRVRARNAAGFSAYSNTASVTTEPLPKEDECPPSQGALCLQGGRFTVRVTWRDPRSGTSGAGTPVAGSDETGFFWFFGPQNLELVVKVLDGRVVNGSFWFFYGALTDVEYTLTVTDTVSGLVRRYHNPAGNVCGKGDVEAFPAPAGSSGAFLSGRGAAVKAPPLPSVVTAGSCAPSSRTLCLAGGRFAVTVDWVNQHASDATGLGAAVPGTDESGFFWFFGPENLELVVKVLDGRAVNGHFWVFYGALSDVAYTVRVRDTLTGKVVDYRNPPGNICGRADVAAF